MGPSLRLGWRGWLLALIGAAASLAFIAAFKTGLVGNVAIIYATVPFAAAVLALLLLGERVRRQTMLAALVSLAGVTMVMLPGAGGGSVRGNVLALVMMLLSALYMVLVRKFRDTPVVWAAAVSAFLLFGLRLAGGRPAFGRGARHRACWQPSASPSRWRWCSGPKARG